MKHQFYVNLEDNDLNSLVDKEGNVEYCLTAFTLEEALDLIAKSLQIEKLRYGFEAHIENKGINKSVFFRFGNITTRKRDSAESFIKKNWNIN